MMDSITVGAKIKMTETVTNDYPIGSTATISHDHHFKWWFDISPIRAILLARLKGGHCKPFTYHLFKRLFSCIFFF